MCRPIPYTQEVGRQSSKKERDSMRQGSVCQLLLPPPQLLIYISQDLGTGEDDVSFLNHHLSSLCSCLSNSESGLTQMSYLSSFFPCSLSEMFIDSMNPIKNNVVQGSCPWGSVLFLLPGQAINCQPLIYALDPTHPGAGSTGASLSLR